MLYVGDLVEQTDVGLKSILGIRSGRLANFFSTIMLLWAGQLALLIYWYRRKSRNDFHGRYRQWIWVGVTLQFFLAVVATEAHQPFGEYMQRVWPLNVPQYTLLSWLIPAATVGLAMFRLLGMEMRNCACSRTLLWVAGVSGLVAALSLVIGNLIPQRASDLIQVGSATLAHLGLATSLLFHARYVIHVSNEPPPVSRNPSIVRRCRIWMTEALRFESFRLPRPRLKVSVRGGKNKSTSGETAGKPAREASSPERKSNSDDRRPAPSARKSQSPEAQEQKHRIDPAATLKGPRHTPTTSQSDDGVDTEEASGPSEQSGLSKKERRRLRKMQQEARRHAHSAR